jgi:hypothetical protein
MTAVAATSDATKMKIWPLLINADTRDQQYYKDNADKQNIHNIHVLIIPVQILKF